MSKNIILYFSGTGNCLYVARRIANAIADSEIVSMGSINHASFDYKYDSVGFVFPTYFQGIPLAVRNFVANLQLDGSTYFYAVTTYGALAGNSLSQLKKLLEEKQFPLHYGAKLVMVSNYIVMYDLSKKAEEINRKSKENLLPILEDIQKKRRNKIKKRNLILEWYYNMRVKRVPMMDKKYTVTSQCTACGICSDVCPVENIEMVDDKPVFKHCCEQCMACIQFCPNESINYKDVTRKRTRYTNPDISPGDLSEKNIFSFSK